MAFSAEHGFPPSEFRRLAIGPVVKKDEVDVRFVIENEIWSAAGERAATMRSTGGWLDLRARKLIAPPPAPMVAFAHVPRAPGFVEMPPVAAVAAVAAPAAPHSI